MAVLENLEPKKVFHFFEEISEVPRGTFNIKRISDYCTKFAKDRNLEVVQDEVGNVVIKKPGTTGYEVSRIPSIWSLGLICRFTLLTVWSSCSRPLAGRYSAWTGIMTLLAAANALTVSIPREG